MSKQFCEDLISCIDTLENDDSVRTMVLTSSKPGIFSAGLDITEFYQRDEAHVRDFWATVLEMHYRLYSAGLVTIAAMNGTSPAGGVVLALSCDYRVMVDNPKFRMGLNETQLGLCPPEWLSRLQIDAMGQVAGERSIFLGSLFNPSEALNNGLIDQLVAAEDLDTTVLTVADSFHKIPIDAIVGSKQNSTRKARLDWFNQNRAYDIDNFVRMVTNAEDSIGSYLDGLKKRSRK